MRKYPRNGMRETLRWLPVTLAALLTVNSCGSLAAHSERGSVDEWLKSEHSLIKKRITFLERENSVLAKENTGQAEKIRELQAKIALLQSEVGAWKAKYLQETETLTAELSDLLEQKTSLETESAQRIQELEAIRDGDRQRYEAETEILNQQFNRQREAFNLEKENMRNEAVKKQAALAQRIEGLDKDLAARDATIESLRTLNEDLSRKFENGLREIGEKSHSLRLLQQEVRQLRGARETSRDATTKAPSRTETNAP